MWFDHAKDQACEARDIPQSTNISHQSDLVIPGDPYIPLKRPLCVSLFLFANVFSNGLYGRFAYRKSTVTPAPRELRVMSLCPFR